MDDALATMERRLAALPSRMIGTWPRCEFLRGHKPPQDKVEETMEASKTIRASFQERAAASDITNQLKILQAGIPVKGEKPHGADMGRVYLAVLAGVSKLAFEMAVRQVLKGEASYTETTGEKRHVDKRFFPSAAELLQVSNAVERSACNKAGHLVRLLECEEQSEPVKRTREFKASFNAMEAS